MKGAKKAPDAANATRSVLYLVAIWPVNPITWMKNRVSHLLGNDLNGWIMTWRTRLHPKALERGQQRLAKITRGSYDLSKYLYRNDIVTKSEVPMRIFSSVWVEKPLGLTYPLCLLWTKMQGPCFLRYELYWRWAASVWSLFCLAPDDTKFSLIPDPLTGILFPVSLEPFPSIISNSNSKSSGASDSRNKANPASCASNYIFSSLIASHPSTNSTCCCVRYTWMSDATYSIQLGQEQTFAFHVNNTEEKAQPDQCSIKETANEHKRTWGGNSSTINDYSSEAERMRNDSRHCIEYVAVGCTFFVFLLTTRAQDKRETISLNVSLWGPAPSEDKLLSLAS